MLAPMNLFRTHAYPLVAAFATIFGMACYFNLPYEPSVAIGVIMSIVAITLTIFFRHYYIKSLCGIGFIFFSLAFGYASFYSQNIETISLPNSYEEKQVWVRGKIVDIWPSKKRSSLTLSYVKVYGLSEEHTPQTIKLSLDNTRAGEYSIGHWVAAQAVLRKPKEPQFKNDYNQQKADYFKGIGARGYVMGSIYPTWVEPHERYESLNVDIQRIRSKISKSLTETRTETSAVASALLTGVKGKISPEVYDNFRHSGLAHVLAISGLHLALFGGFIFVLIRRVICLWPALVLKYSSKKIAAIGALAGTFSYMLLAGATVPTMRAFIMIALLFVGILFNRIKMSMRSLCIAVIVILFLYPESVLTVSFQMSFIAVFALILWNDYKTKGAKSRIKLVSFIDYIKATALTALIAGLATMPVAAYHFQEISMGGFIANIIAVPVTAMWIMPCGLFVLLLMPFGWHGWVQNLMEMGIGVLIKTAQTVSGFSWSHFDIGFEIFGFLVIAVITTLMFIFVPRYWKLIFSSALVGILSVALLPNKKADIIWLAGGDIILLNTEQGVKQVYETPKKSKRVLSSYMRKQRVPLITGKPATCDSIGCIYSMNNAQIIALEKGAIPTLEDCKLNNIIIPLKMNSYCGENIQQVEEYLYAEGLIKNGQLQQKFYKSKQVRVWQ